MTADTRTADTPDALVADILAAARACLGTPFRHQGRIPGLALDCAGLVVHVVNALGLPYQDEQGYSRLPHHGRLEAALDMQPALRQIPVAERAPGDVLLMRFRAEPTHLGILAGDTVIHAYEQAGKVCEHRMDAAWTARIARVYRIVRGES